MADAGTSHGNLFRDGTIRNSRTNCSAARCIVSLADGLVSINQEKLVDHQFRIMAAHSFSKQTLLPPPSVKQSCQCYSKTGMSFSPKTLAPLLPIFLACKCVFASLGSV